MLVSKYVIINWNSRNKNKYESLGYTYTGMKTPIEVKIENITNGSLVDVILKCDYCGKNFNRRWNYYIKTHETSEKDSCTNCYSSKSKDTNMIKYGVSSVMMVKRFKDKGIKTNIKKYGVKNVFMNESIKSKIIKANIKKYGVKSYTQTQEYKEKTKKTNLSKYGVESHMKLEEYKEMLRGKSSRVWKGGKHDERWDRLQPKYKKWRMSVFSRDNFICVNCNIKKEYLEAHHINNWKDFPEFRYDVENGITFCVDCHINFHRIFGKKNNNILQLNEFLKR